jgi:hypothetical protein
VWWYFSSIKICKKDCWSPYLIVRLSVLIWKLQKSAE